MNVVAAIAADPRIPALPAALAGDRMRQEFQLALFDESGAGRYRIEDCEIERLRYKAGQKCVVCYALHIGDVETGTMRRLYISARVFPRGLSGARYRKALRQQLVQPPIGRPVLHLEHLDMVAWTFPNERKLKGLPELAGPSQRIAQLLRGLARERHGASAEIVETAHRIQHYVPEHTCTARVDMTIRGGGQVRPWTIYGKTYQDDSGRTVFERMRELSAATGAGSGLRVPAPLAWDEGSRTLWQEGLEGEPLGARGKDVPMSRQETDRVAAAIAGLHGIPLTGLASSSVADAVADVRSRAKLIAASLPRHAALLAGVVENIALTAPAQAEIGTLHGDLHPGNIFMVDGSVALIDFDALHRGPLLADLGSWGAGEVYRCLLAGEAVNECIETWYGFVDAYAAACGRSFRRQDIDWFLAVMLVRERCARAVSRLKAGRIDIVARMLDLAAGLVGGSNVPRAAAGGAP